MKITIHSIGFHRKLKLQENHMKKEIFAFNVKLELNSLPEVEEFQQKPLTNNNFNSKTKRS